jgi:hypothetical protein
VADRVEQDLAQLETLLRQLEKEYDQFFSGQKREEPTKTEKEFLGTLKASAARTAANSTQAFKYNTLVARYHAFKTVWNRRLRQREEGRGAHATRPSPARAESHPPAAAAARQEYLTSDPLHEPRHLQQFFETYRRMRETSGESNAKLRPESFGKALAEKVEKIKREQKCDSVLLRVVTDQGRTRLVAKPFRRASSGTDAPP